MTVSYETGLPVEIGVYACRVPMVGNDGQFIVRNCKRSPEYLLEDVFLLWDGRHWYHSGSSVRFRLDVKFFIGPLQRVHSPC